MAGDEEEVILVLHSDRVSLHHLVYIESPTAGARR